MRPVIPLCVLVTAAVLMGLVHAVVIDARETKAIEILHMPRLMMTGQKLGFQVRFLPVDSDRIVYAIVCATGSACSTRELDHERLSEHRIEGASATPLWSPPPWDRLEVGEYTVVATIGPLESIRALDRLSLEVHGF